MKMLAIKDLSKCFGGIKAVSGCSLTVEKGNIVGIIGPNGAGKTTVFNLISGVTKPDEGSIVLDDVEISNVTQEKIARMGIARTFQNIRLFKGLNVLNNVKTAYDYQKKYYVFNALLWTPRASRREKEVTKNAMEHLKLLGLDELAYEKPENLPYGLQRKLEIARALAMEPKLLLLDEPGAGLNPEELLGLIDFIRQINNDLKLTILVIEHRMDLIVSLCQKVYVLNFGKNISSGTPAEIQNDPKVLEAYLGSSGGGEDYA